MNAAKRVLMTADPVGGVWAYALELCRELARRGAQIALAVMGAPLTAAQQEEARAIPCVSLFESSYKLEWMDEPWEDVERASSWLVDIERSFAPEVVHLNQYCFGALPFRAPALVVGHSCVLSWWRAVHGCDAPAEWDRYRREVTRGLAGAAFVAAPTAAMLDALQTHYGPLPRATAVLPNGASPRAPAARKEPFVLSAGRLWDEAKNLRALERAAPLLNWPVYVAGDERPPLGREYRPREGRSATFLGKLDSRQMASWMSRASIYALPALYEPFGLSALEAALAGCALVLGDVPSLREVWGEAAVFAPARDAEVLARAIRRLVDSPDERTEMAARACRRAAMFSSESMADSYAAVYETLAARRA